MRIAQIAPLIERVPPKKYGGTERVVHDLTEELVIKGHEVTLFATGDSETSARLVSVYPRGLRQAHLRNIYTANPWTVLNVGSAYANYSDFDIIHDHNEILSLPTANICPTPSVFTLHGAFRRESRRLFETLPRPYLVSISNSQIPVTDGINYAGTVYNGLRMDSFPFSREHDGYLLFVGRISMDKGTHFAIEVAQYLNLPLIIAAKLDIGDIRYYHEYIEPLLSDQVRWVGEVDEEERNRLMSRAMCMLLPVVWAEPFGLVLIEAAACGCPVIAFNRGSIPEILVDGKTGFVVHGLSEMIEAVSKVGNIKRSDCRLHVLSKFNAKRMADRYERIYESILQG